MTKVTISIGGACVTIEDASTVTPTLNKTPSVNTTALYKAVIENWGAEGVKKATVYNKEGAKTEIETGWIQYNREPDSIEKGVATFLNTTIKTEPNSPYINADNKTVVDKLYIG
jgi:hypothetical protein